MNRELLTTKELNELIIAIKDPNTPLEYLEELAYNDYSYSACHNSNATDALKKVRECGRFLRFDN
jgi:hypothetical protein